MGGPYEFGWGPTDDDESIEAIRHAIESGVNWVDTAAVYGRGHSEEVVGRALQPWRAGEEVFVFTKCGRNFYDGSPEISSNLRPETIRWECELSLKRLGVNRIDLLQFHWPDPTSGTAIEDSWGTLGDLIHDGKVRWGGVSNFDVPLLERCEAIRHIDSAQPKLNLIERAARKDVIPWCAQQGIGILTYSPMASGLLTGKFRGDLTEMLAPDDWRRRSVQFQEPNLSRNLDLVERLRPIADRLGTTLASLAVAWTLAIPGVTASIVGARTADQVDGWLPASSVQLGQSELAEIELTVTESGAGEG